MEQTQEAKKKKFDLSSYGIDLQLYSNNVTFRENPFFCTILAFVHLLNFPDDAFEIAGMLYGTFHLPETEITLFQASLQIADNEHGSEKIGKILEQ